MPTAPPVPIDLVHLARQCAGDHALEQELLALFADQCVKLLGEIKAADHGRGRDAAHSLKGAARAVGAWEVAAAAEVAESGLAAGAAEAACLPALEQATARARTAILAMRQAA